MVPTTNLFAAKSDHATFADADGDAICENEEAGSDSDFDEAGAGGENDADYDLFISAPSRQSF